MYACSHGSRPPVTSLPRSRIARPIGASGSCALATIRRARRIEFSHLVPGRIARERAEERTPQFFFI